MTENNDDGHILYEKGDFSFISNRPEWKRISEMLIPLLEKAFHLYEKHDMHKFFTEYPPPSEHQYIWWLPHQTGFEEWDIIRKILHEQLYDEALTCSDFDLITRVLSHFANNGWQTLIKDFDDILDIIMEKHYDYEWY